MENHFLRMKYRDLVSESFILPPGSGCLMHCQAKDTELNVSSALFVDRLVNISLDISESDHDSNPV